MPKTTTHSIKRIALIGGGVIGAGWAARALAAGLEVRVFDPQASAPARMDEILNLAWPSLKALKLAKGTIPRKKLRFCASLAETLEAADFVQENAPDREALKIDLIAEMDGLLPPTVPISSSSSTFLPSRLQSKCKHPERVLCGHPFNPVYLMPLCEIVAGAKTKEPALAAAEALYKRFGMHTLRLKKEIDSYLANRLQNVVWDEMMRLIKEGVASPEDMDQAMAYGPGLRWAFWGPTQIYHLAGGDGGMRHFLEHFRDKLSMTQAQEKTMIQGAERMANGLGIRGLERQRDAALVAIIKALAPLQIGPGTVLARPRAARKGPAKVKGS